MSDYYLELYENPAGLSDEEFWSGVQMLPQERKDKVFRYLNILDKKLSYLAYKLLRDGLYKYYGIEWSSPLEFVYGGNEKPFLKDYPEIWFNISHCKEAVACVFSDRRIGVDVEGLIDWDEDLLARIASLSERESIIMAEHSRLACAVLWTKKESYLKMTGEGLVDDLPGLIKSDFDEKYTFKHTFQSENGYVLGVCYDRKY